jgi:uncharacterized protein
MIRSAAARPREPGSSMETVNASVSPEPAPTIAAGLKLPATGVAAVLRLLDEGSTVPFLARYRKEATGGLDEPAIRAIQERAEQLKSLDERRQSVLKSLAEQGRLEPGLEARIRAAASRAELDDLILPLRPRGRTRAMAAREQGLEPLAMRILAQPKEGDPAAEAAALVNAEKGVADAAAALQGARDVVAETIAEDFAVRRLVREHWQREALLVCARIEERTKQPTRFEAYYDLTEPLARMPPHRLLAVRRGEREGVLKVHLEADETRALPKVEAALNLDPASPFCAELRAAIQDGYRRLLLPSIETELRVELKLRGDRMAVDLLAENLCNLLLAPPLGPKRVIGIDPTARSGCKCAAVDEAGMFLGSTTIKPAKDAAKARQELSRLLLEHRPSAIAAGGGAHGRDVETFVRRLVAELSAQHAELPHLKETLVVPVTEAGATAYAASDVGRAELPQLEIPVRAAVSVARRLQDPLAELVKIDPKALVAGQHQHDVPGPLLAEKLDEAFESCVNHVGVDLNSASAPLLARVAGVGPALAARIVKHREEHGPFRGRRQLLEVAGMSPRTFEQCAGFVRVRDGEHPLDRTAIHPERYELVERMAKDLGAALAELVGNAQLARRIQPSRHAGGDVGEPTLLDVLEELKHPGRDPRRPFEPPRFREDVTKPEDLKPGMTLEGVVTNVTGFGAFVDVGVHQDGLVHVSQLADRFVKDPHELVKVGDRLTVRVLEVDVARKRIALAAKKEAARPDPTPPAAEKPAGNAAERPAAKERAAGAGDRRGDGNPRREPRGRDRAPPRAPLRAPAPRPLTPQDAQKQGRNNPLGDLLKGLFEKKDEV